MTQDMTEMIVTERNTYCETEPARCHNEEREMARCTQGVPKVYPRCTHTLGRLMSMLRVWLEYAWSMARVWLEAGKKQARSSIEPIFVDFYSVKSALRSIIVLLTLLMTLGVVEAWAQDSDYSGTYLIKSVSVNQNPAGDYYICPTEGWIYYTGTNSFTETDNGQPFLSSYQ